MRKIAAKIPNPSSKRCMAFYLYNCMLGKADYPDILRLLDSESELYWSSGIWNKSQTAIGIEVCGDQVISWVLAQVKLMMDPRWTYSSSAGGHFASPWIDHWNGHMWKKSEPFIGSSVHGVRAIVLKKAEDFSFQKSRYSIIKNKDITPQGEWQRLEPPLRPKNHRGGDLQPVLIWFTSLAPRETSQILEDDRVLSEMRPSRGLRYNHCARSDIFARAN